MGTMRHWAVAAGLAGLISAGGIGAAYGEELRLDFRKGMPDRGMAAVIGTDHGGAVRAEVGGLRVTITEGAGRGGPVGVRFRRLLRGDFEVTAEYAGLKAGPPRDGSGAGVVLLVELDTPGRDGLTVERLSMPKEGEKFNSTYMFTKKYDTRQYRPLRTEARGNSGRLRLSRVGPRVTASYDDGGGEFQVLRAEEVGTADVALVRLGCKTGQTDCPVDAVLVGLAVRADGFAPVTGPKPSPAGASRPWVWVVALLAATSLVGLILWWRGGARPRQAGDV